jgi:prepilin-type processing-associated H-X9-DG protein
MNAWLGVYGVTMHNNRNYQLPGPHASFHRLRPSTMLMSEAYNNGGFSNNGALYYNPRHSNMAPVLYTDGRVELTELNDVPSAPCMWCVNTPGEMAAQADERVEFWGLYMLEFYSDPATHAW